MGTNYYVKQKVEYNPLSNTPSSYGTFEDSTPVRIKNGWVYEDTYYATVENLNDNHERTIHIGKSSHGWKFLLCAYLELELYTLEDWQEFWSKEGVRIINEYGEEVSTEKMLDIILNREEPEEGFSKRGEESYIIGVHPTYEVTDEPEFS